MKISDKERNRQINKEVIITIGLYLAYFVWWYVTGFVMGEQDPSTYKFILGLPVWFILNSIIGPIIFIVAVIFTVKFFFKNFTLESQDDGEDVIEEKTK